MFQLEICSQINSGHPAALLKVQPSNPKISYRRANCPVTYVLREFSTHFSNSKLITNATFNRMHPSL
jgi:hypothetical protein